MALARGNLLQTEEAQQTLGITSSTPANATALQSFINAISAFVSREIKRPVKETTATEYLDGLGGKSLNTINYPIITLTSVHDDLGRTYGSTSEITEGTDFDADYDSGILRRRQSTFGDGTRNVQVVYLYGPKAYEVITGISDSVVFDEDGVESTATIVEGLYSASQFATALQTALNAATSYGTYTVTYSETGERFTISVTGAASTFGLKVNSNSQTLAIGRMMGMFTTANQTEASSQTSSEPSAGVDIEVKEVAMLLLAYHQKLLDKDWIGVRGERRADTFILTNIQDIPPYIRQRLDSIRDVMPKVVGF